MKLVVWIIFIFYNNCYYQLHGSYQFRVDLIIGILRLCEWKTKVFVLFDDYRLSNAGEFDPSVPGEL